MRSVNSTFAGVLMVALCALAPGFCAAGGDDDWLGQDKALHFGVSIALESCGYWALREGAELSRPASLFGGAALSLSAGLAKELADETFGGKDMFWNCIGVGVGSLAWYFVDMRNERVVMGIRGTRVTLAYERHF